MCDCFIDEVMVSHLLQNLSYLYLKVRWHTQKEDNAITPAQDKQANTYIPEVVRCSSVKTIIVPCAP